MAKIVLSDRLLEARRVIAVLPNRQQATLEAYLMSWPPPLRAAVQEVALDLWLPYHQAVSQQLPQARITADRFQVMHNLLARLNEARRALQQDLAPAQRRQVKGGAPLLNKHAGDLTAAEAARLQQIKEVVPDLGRLHDFKEQFRAIYEHAGQGEQAARQLDEWIRLVTSSGSAPLAKFVSTVQNWRTVILNYFASRVTSGPVEGLNTKIKLVLRRAFGLRNFAHLRLRLMMECAGTTLAH